MMLTEQDFPAKNMSRQNRRKKEFERKAKAMNTMNMYGDFNNDKWAIKNANNLKPCSCSMCGNPRKFYGEKTLQEKKVMLRCAYDE